MNRHACARFALLVVPLGTACDGGTRLLGVGPAAKIIVSDGGAGGSAGSTGESSSGGTSGTTSSPGGSSATGASSSGNGGSGASAGGGGAPAGSSANAGFGAAGEDAQAGAAGDSDVGTPTGRGTLTRISVTSDGTASDDWSVVGRPSGDGRFIAFYSLATNLGPPDENDVSDVFLHDRRSGRTVLASADSNGRPGDFASWIPSASATGSVCFASSSTTFAPDRTSDWSAIYVSGPLVADDTFLSGTQPITPADADELSGPCTISDDGRFVAFYSYASNLISDSTRELGTYVFDGVTGITERVRYGIEGMVDVEQRSGQGPILSADGSLLALEVTDAATKNVVVHRLASGETERVPVTYDGSAPDARSYGPSLSADGGRIAFVSDATNLVSADTNAWPDAFVRDLSEGSVERVSVSTNGVEADGTTYEVVLSGDGRFVAFSSNATNLIDGEPQEKSLGIYLRDLETRVTVRVALPFPKDGELYEQPWLSHDGGTLIFSSNVPNLVAGDDTVLDVYAFDFER